MLLPFAVSEFMYVCVQGLFYILLLFFTLHTVFLSYHWFAYGNSKRLSMLALAIYLCGGAVLLLTFSFAIRAL